MIVDCMPRNTKKYNRNKIKVRGSNRKRERERECEREKKKSQRERLTARNSEKTDTRPRRIEIHKRTQIHTINNK